MRIAAGTMIEIAVKEHIDSWNKTFDIELYKEVPALTGLAYVDAWLAGAAHYEAYLLEKECPLWATEPVRFLAEPLFIGGKNARMFALKETPFPWRIRQLYCGRTSIRSSSQVLSW